MHGHFTQCRRTHCNSLPTLCCMLSHAVLEAVYTQSATLADRLATPEAPRNRLHTLRTTLSPHIVQSTMASWPSPLVLALKHNPALPPEPMPYDSRTPRDHTHADRRGPLPAGAIYHLGSDHKIYASIPDEWPLMIPQNRRRKWSSVMVAFCTDPIPLPTCRVTCRSASSRTTSAISQFVSVTQASRLSRCFAMCSMISAAVDFSSCHPQPPRRAQTSSTSRCRAPGKARGCRIWGAAPVCQPAMVPPTRGGGRA